MNKYESILILNDKISEDNRNKALERVKKFIKENGKIEEINDMGLRRLAYKIQKCEYGYYFQIYFSAESSMIAELERIYRITDEIMKFITVKR